MSKRCDITGLSAEDINLFGYLHSQLIGELELNEVSNETLTGFEKPLQRTVSNHRLSTGDLKRKESLIKHLEKSINFQIQWLQINCLRFIRKWPISQNRRPRFMLASCKG
ncbi:MAG: hypothetical protein ACJZ6A_08080 [Candidatus Poseidoniaceae archaeon]